MKRLVGCVVLILALAPVLSHGAPKVKGNKLYKQYEPIVLKAEEVSGADVSVLWDVVEGKGARIIETKGTAYVWAPPGQYTIKMTAIDFVKKTVERTEFTFTVEGLVPPPGPNPPPPPPGPSPIPVEGFRALIIYETSELSKMPAAQSNILYAQSVRDYLNAKCVVGPDSKTREWRIWDKDVSTDAESKLWQDAMKRKRDSVPWLIISTGKGGFEGPLPANVDETLVLLKKYGDVK